jgi:hypothetical protein
MFTVNRLGKAVNEQRGWTLNNWAGGAQKMPTIAAIGPTMPFATDIGGRNRPRSD